MFFLCINIWQKGLIDIINKESEFKLNNNIAEVTNITIESEFDLDGNVVDGLFLVKGSYKTHSLSLNKEDFDYSIPFTYTISEYFKEDSVNVLIKDFDYNIDNNILRLNINYDITYEKDDEYFYERQELDDYLNNHEVEVIDFNEKNDIPPISIEEEKIEKIDTEDLFDSFESGDEYITYDVYICSKEDTFESVSKKFNVSTKVLHDYNDEIENITESTKLIIPLVDE